MGLTEVPGAAVGHFGQNVARFSRAETLLNPQTPAQLDGK